MVTPELAPRPAPFDSVYPGDDPGLCGKTSESLSRLVIAHLPCDRPAGHPGLCRYESL